MSDRKKDIVKTYLRDRLVRGCYRFGERISARDLSEATDASRFMVISALNELRTEGFVEITAQVGCAVIRPTVTEITDFFVAFARLEGTLAEFAAGRHEPDDIAQLRWTNDQLRTLASIRGDAGETYRTLNLAFHDAVHAAARSPRLAERQSVQWAMADFFVTQTRDYQLHIGDSVAEHDRVIAAIETRDGDTARVAMEAHIRQLGNAVVAEQEAVFETAIARGRG